MTSLGPSDTASERGEVCPECRREGKRVKRVTLESLLIPSAIGRIGERAYRFCPTPGCEMVYYGSDGSGFMKNDLTVRVGVKETTAPRPVCYCFEHTVEDIEAQVATTGESTVLDDIKTKLRDGCWCETKNPQGTCCLSVVSRCIADAKARSGLSKPATMQNNEHQDCCGPAVLGASDTGPVHAQRGGLWAAGASALSALLASACCWLPFVLLAFGVSAAGVVAVFEKARPIFLSTCAALLGLGFYFVYFRRSPCVPGTACATRDAKSQRRNRVVLWSATVAVVLFAFFPSYAGLFVKSGAAVASMSVDAENPTLVFDIEGMTCETCAAHIQQALFKVPGVNSAVVLYQEREARVAFDQMAPPAAEALIRAVEGAGYKATLRE